jgi:penicillin amidase
MSKFVRRLLVTLSIILVLALLLAGAGVYFVRRSFPRTNGSIQVAGLQDSVEIFRDPMGVPHIYATNQHDLFFAQGYVHAQDRFWQMEFWRRIGSGRLSEILGDGGLEQDRFIRTLGWHRAAAQEFELLGTDEAAILDSGILAATAALSSPVRTLLRAWA